MDFDFSRTIKEAKVAHDDTIKKWDELSEECQDAEKELKIEPEKQTYSVREHPMFSNSDKYSYGL
ncbi:MAG: hypothetical protein ACWGHH_06680 [Sulfurovaceae bacterium]